MSARPTYDELLDALRECADVLDDYVDVNDGDYGQPVANRAMSLLEHVEYLLDRADGK